MTTKLGEETRLSRPWWRVLSSKWERTPVRRDGDRRSGFQGLSGCEALESRIVLDNASMYEVYALQIINKMRADPAAFGAELRSLYKSTGFVSSHGVSGSDPIWTDLRAEIAASEGKPATSGAKPWYSGFDGRSGNTFLSVISSMPKTGPLALFSETQAAAERHNVWMKANGYAHTEQRPASRVDGLGYNPSATPDKWLTSGWFISAQGENIGYSYGSVYPATTKAWKNGTLSETAYLQRVAYASTLSFMFENHNGSASHPWGHLENLAAYSPGYPATSSLTASVLPKGGGSGTLSTANAIGIDFAGASSTALPSSGLFVETHRTAYYSSLSFASGVIYRDNNGNGFYDCGEGLKAQVVVGTGSPPSNTPGLFTTDAGYFCSQVSIGDSVTVSPYFQSADLGWRQVAATQAYTAGKPNWYREWRLPTNFQSTWAALRITDFDGDGRADMMLRDSVTGTIVGQLRGADGGIRATRTLGVDGAWTFVTAADFSGDGIADIVWRQASTGACVVWVMTGAGKLASSFGIGGNKSELLEATGDYNGDGQEDVIWRNSQTGMNTMYLLKDGKIAKAAGIGGGTVWRLAPTGPAFDADGDGRTDLVWRLNASGANVLWRMNGSTMKSSNVLGGDLSWSIVAAGDLDGDGQGDLVWRYAPNGGVAVWMMNNGSLRSSAVIGGSTDWVVVGTADVNADRKSDVVWRVKSKGVNVVGVMNGATMAALWTAGGDLTRWSVIKPPGAVIG